MAWEKEDEPSMTEGPKLDVSSNVRRLRAYWARSLAYYRANPGRLKFELFSGLTVGILNVPESVAFSFVAGVHPLQGLYGSVFIGGITALVGGRPGMISGCAGALAVVVRDVMSDGGPFGDRCLADRREFVMFTMLLCGVLQVVCGVLRLAELAKLISQSAFLGFFNALAIVIGSSQLESFRKPKPSTLSSGVLERHGTAENCAPVDFGPAGQTEWYTFEDKEFWLMVLHIVLVMSVIHLIPKIPEVRVPGTKASVKPANIIPPCLVGILLSMAVEWGLFRGALDLRTTLVKDYSPIKGEMPSWHWPDVPWGEWDSYAKCLPIAASLCGIGLVESVLTLQAVDEILDQTTPSWMKHLECVAQGLGNGISGLFLALGGDAMIGQSTVNVLNGAEGRLSALSAAAFILLFVVVASPFIEIVPLAGLAGILFVVVIHCFQWHSVVLILRRKIPVYESVTIILVTVLAVIYNLAIGVGAGVVWDCVCRAWISSGSQLRVLDPAASTAGKARRTYAIDGAVFFANAADFCKLFDPAGDPPVVVADFSNCEVVDYSAFFALNRVGKRYKELKKSFIVSLREQDHQFYTKLSSGLPDIEGVVFSPPLSQAARPASFEEPGLVAARAKLAAGQAAGEGCAPIPPHLAWQAVDVGEEDHDLPGQLTERSDNPPTDRSDRSCESV